MYFKMFNKNNYKKLCRLIYTMNYRPVIIIIDTAIINENSEPISCTDFQKQPI